MSNISQIAESISRENPHLFIFPCGGSHEKDKASLPTKLGSFREAMAASGIYRHTLRDRDGLYWGQIEPDKVKTMFDFFGSSARQIGVWLGQSGKIVFDVDIHKAPADQVEEMQAFIDHWSPHAEMVVSTQSGGYHLWFTDDDPDQRRTAIHPYIDIKRGSGYALWPFEGSGYEVLTKRSKSRLSRDIFNVIRKPEVQSKSGGPIPDIEEAMAILASNGSSGQRHDALKGMVKHLFKTEPLKDHTKQTYTDLIEALVVGELAAPAYLRLRNDADGRYEVLVEVTRYKDGEVGGELGRMLDEEFDFRMQNRSVYAEWFGAKKFTLDDFTAALKDVPASMKAQLMSGVTPGKPEATGAANRFQFEDPTKIPPREWLFGKYIQRQTMTYVVAPGGTGKSTLVLAWALSMARGEAWFKAAPVKEMSVHVWSGEDNMTEVRRRLAGMKQGYDLDDRNMDLFIESEADRDINLVIKDPKRNIIPNDAAVNAIIETLKEEKADVFIADPLVRMHCASENSNDEMQVVANCLVRIAREANVGVVVVHHTAKGALKKSNEADPADAGRGASAMRDASRCTVALRIEDAAVVGSDNAVEILDAKQNYSKRRSTSDKDCFELISTNLGNGTELYPGGDDVPFIRQVSNTQIEKSTLEMYLTSVQAMRDAVGDNEAEAPLRESAQSSLWLGYLIADACHMLVGQGKKQAELSIEEAANRATIRDLISRMRADSVIELKRVVDKTRHTRQVFHPTKIADQRIKEMQKALNR